MALPPQPPKAEPKPAVRTVASGVQRRAGLKPVPGEGVPRFLVAGLCPKTVSSPAGKQAREVAKEEARKRQQEANERQQEANERQRHRTSTASAAAHRQPTQPAPQAIGLAELRQLLSAEVSGGQLPPPLGSVVKLRVSTLGQRRVVCNVEQYLGDVDAGEELVAAEVTNVGRAEADGMFTVRFEDAETEEEVSVNVDWRPFKLPESLQTVGQALTSAEQMTAETDKLRWPCRMHGTRACVYYKLPAQGGAAATALWGTAQANGLSAGVRRVFDRLCDEATTLAKRLRTEMKSLRRRLASDEESLTAGGPAQSGVSRAQRQRWLQAEALGYRAWLNAQFCSIDEGRVTAHLGEGRADDVLARPFGIPITRSKLRCLNPPSVEHDGWLNDSVIQAFLTVVGRSVPSVHVFDTQFYTKLTQSHTAYDVQAVSRWSRRLDGTESKILVPVNFEGDHWALASVDLQAKTLTYLDSWPNASGEPTIRSKRVLDNVGALVARRAADRR